MTQTIPAKKNFFNQNVDLMNGPIFKSLFIFMLPIFVSNLFQQLYNTVDTMIVGNVLGDTALAAIGSCGSIYELLVGFGIGIGNGLAIVAARSYGAQDEDLLKKTVAGSLVIGFLSSLCITLAGLVGLHPLLVLLDTPAEILEEAYSYILIIDVGVLVMFAYNLCAGLLRAIGNSFMPLVFLLISSGLNVALDLMFIAVVGMGVKGAAVATVISQGVSVVLCIFYVLRKTRVLVPERKHFQVGRKLYWDLFSQSISMGLMSSIVSAGSVVLQYGINGLGTLVIAGHTAARKMFAFTDMPLIAMANAGSTFVSQNYGANHPDRVRKGMREIHPRRSEKALPFIGTALKSSCENTMSGRAPMKVASASRTSPATMTTLYMKSHWRSSASTLHGKSKTRKNWRMLWTNCGWHSALLNWMLLVSQMRKSRKCTMKRCAQRSMLAFQHPP